jgi:RNA polymerase sigma-70 factor, ECF subfamily
MPDRDDAPPHPDNIDAADEAALSAGLRRRDEAAFVVLLERHQAALRRLARSYVPNDAVAEEVVQETWIGVLRGIDRFEGRSSLTTWIFAILINCARRRGAQERRSQPFADFAPDDDGPTVDPERFFPPGHRWAGHWAIPPEAWAPAPDDAALAAEMRGRIAAAIAALPPGQRQVLLLRDVEGWAATDVCHVLALTETNQRVLLHRARARLRTALDAYYRGAASE